MKESAQSHIYSDPMKIIGGENSFHLGNNQLTLNQRTEEHAKIRRILA
jgi:hypothetical protein